MMATSVHSAGSDISWNWDSKNNSSFKDMKSQPFRRKHHPQPKTGVQMPALVDLSLVASASVR